MADYLAQYLRSKGRGATVIELAPAALEWLVYQVLAKDDRFAEGHAQTWELVSIRDARLEAVMREPEPTDPDAEFAPVPEDYVVPSIATGEVRTDE